MTPDQERARTARLVSAARAMLTHQVGMTVGAKRIELALYRLGASYEKDFPIFAKFISAIPVEIPLGTARLEWPAHMILNTDRIIAGIEKKYRHELLEDCIEIIHRIDRERGNQVHR
jgi:hypothetical protein